VRCEPDGTATLVDVGSTNGTYVGGERLAHNAPTPLTDGMEIRFGKSAMTFSSRREAPAETSPQPDATAAARPAENEA
jgi:pSer/pThr/pTyr-binding forkhead associated (FHA) protein